MPSKNTQRKRAPRGTGQRTRTGCLTCKQRRVKCDETKPFCRRCTEGGHECTGYPEVEIPRSRQDQSPSARPSAESSRRRQERSPSRVSTAGVPVALSSRISWTAGESRSIEFIVRNLIPGLIGECGSKFWGRHVLQLGHVDPAVKHALAALGAVHERRNLALLRAEGATSPSIEEAHARRFALTQYNQSIQHLGKRMAVAATTSTQTALVCCLIFLTLELLQRNNDQALKHLRAGIKIYRSRMPADAASSHRDLMETSDDGIGEIFYRMDSQATGYLDARRPQVVPAKMSRKSPSPPAAMRPSSTGSSPLSPPRGPSPEPIHGGGPSIAGLRARIEDLHKQCIVYLIENQHYRRVPRNRVPEDIVSYHQGLLDDLELLGHSLDAALVQLQAFPQLGEHVRGMQKLIVAHRALSVMTRSHHVDLLWMELDPEYQAVLDAAEELFPVSETRPRQSSTPALDLPFTFTLDATVIPSLFMTAHGAPWLATRRRATDMLRRVKMQEGLWYSEVAADIAERCLEDELGMMSPPISENMLQLACRLGVDESGGFEPMKAGESA